MKIIQLFLLALLLPALPAWSDTIPCEPAAGMQVVCGLAAPEDLVPAPNGRDLIFGQMAEPGGLYLLDRRDHSVHPLLGRQQPPPDGEWWGAAECREPVSWVAAHGLDLRQREDGRWQLLVVNHQGRESVEFYELRAAASDRPTALWRGCAEAPPEGNLNDVAGLADGGLLVTHMADRRSPFWTVIKSVLGVDTGFVYHWTRAQGFQPLPETAGEHPNGIILAPDERSFYLNVYFGDVLREHAWPGGQLLRSLPVDKPDNSSWSPRGTLLVASHHASLWQLFRSLGQPHDQPSLLPFSVVEVDPDTWESSVVLQHEGPPMGAGTAALERGGRLYIGSYVGDRLVHLDSPRAGPPRAGPPSAGRR